MALSFMQMLASTIIGYHDIQGVLHYRINGLEYPDVCTELGDFLECDVSHIDPERQLVENTFALDDCSRLAWKIFHNGDGDWTDYEECGEVPQSLIRMLYRCIVEYGDAYKVNAIIESAACESITALLDCSKNNVESERLLVTNVFAVDDCDRLLIKFLANSSTMEDYHTECTGEFQSFYQLLARCIVLYSGHYYINTATVTGYCDDYHDFWTCANNHLDPESALCENVFCTDSCGNLALKIFNNGGDSRVQ